MHDNIKPCWWGSSLWQTIYFITAVYPKNPSNDQMESINNFFKSLKHILPCNGCQESYNIISCETNTNIDCLENFKTKEKLIHFVFNLRNKINNKLTHEYYININYFKKKLESMIMTENNIYDGKVCEMIEAPFIPTDLEKSVFNYIKLYTNYDIKQAIKIMDILKKFMENPIFDYNDKRFRFTYKRNKKCRKIIKKIYNKMSEGNYDLVQSFLVQDKNLHETLLFLGCTILHKENLESIIKLKITNKDKF
jgi:hypothetical protein